MAAVRVISLLEGDVRAMLQTLEPESVQCVVTSPPYWGLRAYGTNAQVWGGDPEHEHEWGGLPYSPQRDGGKGFVDGGKAKILSYEGVPYTAPSSQCSCGAWLGELGSEPTPQMFVSHLVDVFRAVRRVLRKDGVCFVNLGDSYAGSGKGPSNSMQPNASQLSKQTTNGGSLHSVNTGLVPSGLKPKDLCGMPWRFALAMQDDGWYWRSTIVWAKKSCMPESVVDRPTNAWEPILLFAKSQRYFWDADAVREPLGENGHEHTRAQNGGGSAESMAGHDYSRDGLGVMQSNPNGRNQRNVWDLRGEPVSDFWLLGPEPFPGAHFATFPTEIPRRCILAGTSEKGQCPHCGAPWARVTQPTTEYAERLDEAKTWGSWYASGDAQVHEVTVRGKTYMAKHGKPYESSTSAAYVTTGWRPTCKCPEHQPVPQTILDPFAGSGTTLMVADRLGRHSVGIELNPEYARMARERLVGDAPMFVELAAE